MGSMAGGRSGASGEALPPLDAAESLGAVDGGAPERLVWSWVGVGVMDFEGGGAVLARGEVDVYVLLHGAGHAHCFDGEPLRLGLRGGATLTSLMSKCVLVGYWYFLGSSGGMGIGSCLLRLLDGQSLRCSCYAWRGMGLEVSAGYRSLKYAKCSLPHSSKMAIHQVEQSEYL